MKEVVGVGRRFQAERDIEIVSQAEFPKEELKM